MNFSYKKWCDEHREELNEYHREYRKSDAQKEYHREYYRKWCKEHPENVKAHYTKLRKKPHDIERRKQYYKDNKEHLKELHKKWVEEHPDYHKNKCKEWHDKNKEYDKEYRHNYHMRPDVKAQDKQRAKEFVEKNKDYCYACRRLQQRIMYDKRMNRTDRIETLTNELTNLHKARKDFIAGNITEEEFKKLLDNKLINY